LTDREIALMTRAIVRQEMAALADAVGEIIGKERQQRAKALQVVEKRLLEKMEQRKPWPPASTKVA